MCLKSYHIARNCQSNIKCYKCGNRHHISICETVTDNLQNSTRSQGDPNQTYYRSRSDNSNYGIRTENFRNNPHSPQFIQQTEKFRQQESNFNPTSKPFRSLNNMESQKSGDVNTAIVNQQNYSGVTADVRDDTLLQTAQSVVSSGCTEIVARILFDSCSQYSFINEDICHQLRLPTVRSENMILKAFEMDSETVRTLKVVKVKLMGLNNIWTEIELYVVPKICSPSMVKQSRSHKNVTNIL